MAKKCDIQAESNIFSMARLSFSFLQGSPMMKTPCCLLPKAAPPSDGILQTEQSYLLLRELMHMTAWPMLYQLNCLRCEEQAEMCPSFPDSTYTGLSSIFNHLLILPMSVILLCGFRCPNVSAVGVNKQSGCLMKHWFLGSK